VSLRDSLTAAVPEWDALPPGEVVAQLLADDARWWDGAALAACEFVDLASSVIATLQAGAEPDPGVAASVGAHGMPDLTLRAVMGAP
jgi:hypothetical protein